MDTACSASEDFGARNFVRIYQKQLKGVPLLVRLARSCTILIVCIVVASSMAGCKYLPWSEKSCRQEALRQIGDLRIAVSGLLPESIEIVLEGQDGCDSGDEGGWLSAVMDKKTDAEGIVDRFTSRGWRRIELRPDECNVKCIAGVSGQWNGKVIDVTIGETQDSDLLELIAEFGSPNYPS